MKRFNHILSHLLSPDVLLWLYPLTLIVPNVVLDITEYSHALVKITNILLPLGIYMLLAGWSRNIGRTVLFCLPLTHWRFTLDFRWCCSISTENRS